jgi:hypothetical protein
VVRIQGFALNDDFISVSRRIISVSAKKSFLPTSNLKSDYCRNRAQKCSNNQATEETTTTFLVAEPENSSSPIQNSDFGHIEPALLFQTLCTYLEILQLLPVIYLKKSKLLRRSIFYLIHVCVCFLSLVSQFMYGLVGCMHICLGPCVLGISMLAVPVV